MSFSTFFLQSLSPIALPLPLILCPLSLFPCLCLSLLYTSHIIELEQCQTPAPLVCLFHPKPLASPAQYLISVRICGEPLRINESDMRLISARQMKLGSALLSVYMRVYIYKSAHSGTKERMVLYRMHEREGTLFQGMKVCSFFFWWGSAKKTCLCLPVRCISLIFERISRAFLNLKTVQKCENLISDTDLHCNSK